MSHTGVITFQYYAQLYIACWALLSGVLSGCTQTAHYAQSYDRMTAFRSVKWPQQRGLQLESYYVWRAVDDVIDPPPSAFVEAYAINVGAKPILVATKPRITQAGGRDTYVMIVDWFQDQDDLFQRALIPSQSDLHIVTLASNESALIGQYWLRDPEDLDESNVWFRYEVPDEWGERFGIWSGKITAPLIHWPEWPYTKPITETNYQASMKK